MIINLIFSVNNLYKNLLKNIVDFAHERLKLKRERAIFFAQFLAQRNIYKQYLITNNILCQAPTLSTVCEEYTSIIKYVKSPIAIIC